MSEHFPDAKLACHCCGLVNVDESLPDALEELRIDAGDVPVIVNCACRCKKHNDEVGSNDNSQHFTTEERECKAADIRIPGISLSRLHSIACKVGKFNAGGIGLYPDQGFLHVDVRGMRARWGQIGKRKCSFNEAWEYLMVKEAREGK